MATAREMGDLSENAEYHAAREDQGMLEARINMLKDELSRAFLIDPDTLPTDSVAFGSRVTVTDLDGGDEEEFELVGPGQDDPDKNRILTSSPIAQGLIGKKKGDVAEIPVPRGTLRVSILPSTVGISISPPRAAWLKAMGIWQTRSSPCRSKKWCFLTRRLT